MRETLLRYALNSLALTALWNWLVRLKSAVVTRGIHDANYNKIGIRELQFPLIIAAYNAFRVCRPNVQDVTRAPGYYIRVPTFYTFSNTCGRTNESLTFPVNCGFMVYRCTAETFYYPAMRDNAALTAECPRPRNESNEYTRDAYAGNVFPRVLFFAGVPGISNLLSDVGRRETLGEESRGNVPYQNFTRRYSFVST